MRKIQVRGCTTGMATWPIALDVKSKTGYAERSCYLSPKQIGINPLFSIFVAIMTKEHALITYKNKSVYPSYNVVNLNTSHT